MRRLVLAAAVSIGAITAGASAQAMSVLPSGPLDNGITRVEGGCGPGGHRDPYGRCVPNFRRPLLPCLPARHAPQPVWPLPSELLT